MNFPTYTIRHYPTQLIDVWTTLDGSKVVARPVLPQDGPMLSEMFERASWATRFNRFHSPVNGLSLSRQRDMTEVDYEEHFALVLTVATSRGNLIIGEGRYVVDNAVDRSCATFALSIVDDWQRRGLGMRTMRLLIQSARSAGVRWLHGDVLQDNKAMLKLMGRMDFSCTPNRHREQLVDVEMLLDEVVAGSFRSPGGTRFSFFRRTAGVRELRPFESW